MNVNWENRGNEIPLSMVFETWVEIRSAIDLPRERRFSGLNVSHDIFRELEPRFHDHLNTLDTPS